MKISQLTISDLAKIITGDSEISPYRSGPKLVDFFNQFGFNDTYGQGFPTRLVYAEAQITSLNGTKKLEEVFTATVDPRNFIDSEISIQDMISRVNEFLKFDGYELIEKNHFYKVRSISSGLVQSEISFPKASDISHIFIHEQLEKCETKIKEKDFDGAITNSRSLIEGILREIERSTTGETLKYDGDLVKLYKRVQKILNLEPSRPDISGTLKQILSGFTSIISGLAGMRNKMSDSHASFYKPEKHHAKLAVNTARTLADFIFSTYAYQIEKGFITESNKKLVNC